MNYLPENLKYYRKRCGYTQTDLAAAICKRKSTVCNYENGYTEPSFEVLEQMAEFLHVSVSDLLQNDSAKLREAESSRNTIPILSAETGKPTEEFLILPPSYLGNAVFTAFYMPDDSLKSLRLRRGDLVLCNQNEPVQNGDLVAFFEPSDGILLRYYYEENNRLTLTAPGKLAPLRKKKTEIRLLGRVTKAAVSF